MPEQPHDRHNGLRRRHRHRRSGVTTSLDPRDGHAYRRRGSPMLVFGLMLLLVGLRGYVVPATEQDIAAHEILGTLVYGVWHFSLVASGLLLIIAFVPKLLPEVEVVGLWLGLWAVAVHMIAVVKVLGLLSSPTVAIAAAVMWAFWIRLGDLRVHALHDRRRIQMPIGRERRQ